MHAKAWLRHCSRSCHPDQLRDRVGCAHLIYPVQGVRAAGLQLTPLIYARIWKLRVHQLENICSSTQLVSFSSMSNWRRQRAFIGEKVPENGSFWDQLCRGVGLQATLRANDTHKPYTDELQILSSLCMQGMGFAIAVEVVTPDQLRDRVGCAHLIYPVQVSAQLVCSWLP